MEAHIDSAQGHRCSSEENHAADQGREGDELLHMDGHQVHFGGGGGSVHVQVEEDATNQG